MGSTQPNIKSKIKHDYNHDYKYNPIEHDDKFASNTSDIDWWISGLLARYGLIDSLKYMKSQDRNCVSKRILSVAIKREQYDTVKWLINEGCDWTISHWLELITPTVSLDMIKHVYNNKNCKQTFGKDVLSIKVALINRTDILAWLKSLTD